MRFHPTPRLVGSVTGLALAGALLVVTPAAQADVSDGFLSSDVDIYVYDLGGDTLRRAPICETSSEGEEIEESVTDDGVVKRQSLDAAATISEPDRADRTARATTSVASRLTSAGGSWSTFDFAAATEGEVDPAAEDSECAVQVEGTVREEFEFELAEDGWMQMDVDFASEGSAFAELYLGDSRPRRGGVETYGKYMAGGSVSEATSFFMEAGEYAFNVYVNGGLSGKRMVSKNAIVPDDEVMNSFEVSLNIAASFTPAGEARTALQGSAKRYVKVPGAVDCGTDSIAVSTKANAKKLQFAKFYVNGTLSKKLTKPAKNRSVTLGGLDASTGAVVKAVVKTKKVVKKIKRNGKVIRKVIKPKKFTATRSFLACQ